MVENDEPIPPEYYLNGPDEFVPNESTPAPVEKEEQYRYVPKFSEKHWTEDYSHENGMYQNKCLECHELFFGHKRRVMCKECFNKPPDWETLALKQPPQEIKNNAWPGCWADGEMTGFARCMVKKVKPLQEENARLRSPIEKAFYENNGYQYTWEQFKKENNL
jgi:hypothetical protein